MEEKERIANPNYCLWEQVLMDMKNKNKGYFWKVMSTNIKMAKKELQHEMSSSSTWSWPRTQKSIKGSVLQKARELS
eukprot:4719620-Prorocentrum_lima.AAC.1